MVFQIVVLSGKGGVGKTSITASMACYLAEHGKNLMALDTDVDAPNLSILFEKKFERLEKKVVKTSTKSFFIADKCIHCGKCIEEKFCSFGAIQWDDENMIPIVDQISCEGCKGCYLLCPEAAFEIKPVKSGTIFHIIYSCDDNRFPVISGETTLGAQTSGKLVTKIKEYTNDLIKQKELDKTDKDLYILIDGPPGIGCPVNAAATGVDYAVVVMEPNRSSLHDASRLINVLNGFKIPFGIILNKADAWKKGRQEISRFARENNYNILGEIPIDPDWPESISKGMPFIRYKPNSPTTAILRKIFDKLFGLQKEIIELI